MSTTQIDATSIMKAGEFTRPKPLIKCKVKVTTTTGARFRYAALFASTYDAAIDALEQFGISKINVETAR